MTEIERNALQNILEVLQRIEEKLSAETQHYVIKEAVLHALSGEKYGSTQKAG